MYTPVLLTHRVHCDGDDADAGNAGGDGDDEEYFPEKIVHHSVPGQESRWGVSLVPERLCPPLTSQTRLSKQEFRSRHRVEYCVVRNIVSSR